MNHETRLSRSHGIFAAPPAIKPAREEFDALAIFGMIRRRILLLAVLTAVLTALALPMILSIKPVYYSDARMIIRKPVTATLAIAGTSSVDVVDLDLELEHLRARATLEEVIARLKLADHPEFIAEEDVIGPVDHLLSWIKARVLHMPAAVDTGAHHATSDLEHMIAQLQGGLSIYKVGSEVISIGFSAHDRDLTVSVPNAMIETYVERRERMRQQRIDSAAKWLDQRIAEQLARIEDKKKAIMALQESSGVTANPTDGESRKAQLDAVLARRGQINIELSELHAALSTLDKTAPERLKVSDLGGERPVADLLDDIAAQQERLAGLRTVYGERFQGVIDAQTELDQLFVRLRAETRAYRDRLISREARLASEAKAIDADLAQVDAASADRSLAKIELSQLIVAVNGEAEILAQFEEQKNALNAQRETPALELEVLRPAVAPLWPIGHGRKLYLLAALVAASACALTLVGFRELIDGTVRSHDQLEDVPGLVAAGLLPRASRAQVRQVMQAKGPIAPNALEEAMASVLLTMENVNHGTLPRSLVVTSPTRREGASLVAFGIARALAASGQDVLLVDAGAGRRRSVPFRDSRLRPGLSDYIAQAAELEDIICQTEVPGLAWLPHGTRAISSMNDRSGVLGIVAHAKSKNRLVIFDAPGVLTSVTGLQIASVAERSLLVSRWGRTPRRQLALAAEQISKSGGGVSFSVINHVRIRLHRLYGFRDSQAFAGRWH